MGKRPAIILTSKFSTETSGKSFEKYLGYMARKEALESKDYLSDEEKAKGLITASAGNHAQGVAYPARKFGAPAIVVMPTTTPLL